MDVRKVYLGTDCGGTTSKIGGVWEDGSPISTKLSQRPTNSQKGRAAVVQGWIDAAQVYMGENGLTWDNVCGVGLAIPGPFLAPGHLGIPANLTGDLANWKVGADYTAKLEEVTGRKIRLTVGNDGNYGGVAEAQLIRGAGVGSVLLLAPGSGLGAAYIDEHGLPLDGASLVGMEAGHMPAPLQLLDMPPFTCGCGRTWGCIEAYTTISGLPQLFAQMIKKYPDHCLAASTKPDKEKVLALRTLAQEGDALAVELFDFQARALGYHLANLAMALDPEYVVIGGGLMDPESTRADFRARYMQVMEETAKPFLWPAQRKKIKYSQAKLGDLSQAIGAALVAMYNDR